MKSIAVVSITLCSAVGIALANPPEVKTTVKLKQDAVKIFLDDKTVETKIGELEADQFFLLSIDVAPYFFTFTDEGPVGRFIVAAWLGKALDRVQAFELWARRVTAVIFIGVGVYETLRSTLRLI